MSNAQLHPQDEFARLLAIIGELRDRCPWDREQTIASLSKHLIEEAYEADDAIQRANPREIVDELGDLMAQVLAVGVIAQEQRRFEIAEMLRWAADKLVRRHPHVYGNVEAQTAEQVVENWDEMKKEERGRNGATSALDGIAISLPALMRAQKLGLRARRAGMDWADIHEVLAKVREEIEETEGALSRNDPEAAAEEIGDMMLALANAPRFLGHDAEETLRRACDKFTARFKTVEDLANQRALDLKTMKPEAIESLWQEAKRLTESREDDRRSP